MEKTGQGGRRPYVPRKPQAKGYPKENKPARHNFMVELKDLIVVPNIADKLKMPVKTDVLSRPRALTKVKVNVKVEVNIWLDPSRGPKEESQQVDRLRRRQV